MLFLEYITNVILRISGHDLTCAQYCRNNIEPTTGAQRVCASFNFDGRETCYFFDDAAVSLQYFLFMKDN